MVYEFFECSTNIPSGLSACKPQKLVVHCFYQEGDGLLLLYNNSEDVDFFRWILIDQSERAHLFGYYINRNITSFQNVVQTVTKVSDVSSS